MSSPDAYKKWVCSILQSELDPPLVAGAIKFGEKLGGVEYVLLGDRDWTSRAALRRALLGMEERVEIEALVPS